MIHIENCDALKVVKWVPLNIIPSVYEKVMMLSRIYSGTSE